MFLASQDTQIVIYGKNGHAEVLGLVGQTHGKAIVIETPAEAAHLDFTKDIRSVLPDNQISGAPWANHRIYQGTCISPGMPL